MLLTVKRVITSINNELHRSLQLSLTKMFSLVFLIAEVGRAIHAFATLLSILCAFTFRRSLLSFEMPLVILDEKRRQDRRFAFIQYHTLDGKSVHRLAIQGRCQLSVARLVVDWRAIHWPFLVSGICGIHIPGIKHRASKSEI